jgi:predicted TIM-barrel enzyme
MSGELTGSLSSQVLPNNQASTTQSQQVVVNSNENVENIKNVLREIEEILESNIKQKIKMARYVDKLLKQKNRQYAKEQVKE